MYVRATEGYAMCWHNNNQLNCLLMCCNDYR